MRSISVKMFLMLICLAVLSACCFAEGMPDRQDFLTVGNVVTFGNYEQDDDPDNGPEPIEWIVLDVQDGKCLLLSRYGLDSKPYNTEYTDVTWETCTLRAWLNGDSLSAAFTEEEQSAILQTDVDNSKSQGTSETEMDGGNNTLDQIFVLSWVEAERYLETSFYTVDGPDYPKAQAAPTRYAVAQGAWENEACLTENGEAAGWWWLRSPGFEPGTAASINLDGSINTDFIHTDDACIRPVLWLDLDSGIF